MLSSLFDFLNPVIGSFKMKLSRVVCDSVPTWSPGGLYPGVGTVRLAASSYFQAPNLELACPSPVYLFLESVITLQYLFL